MVRRSLATPRRPRSLWKQYWCRNAASLDGLAGHRAGDVLDVVGIARDERYHALRPQFGDDAGGAAAPVVAAEYGALDVERLRHRQKVRAERRLLAQARRLGLEEPRGPAAAQIGSDDPRLGFGQHRGYVRIGVRVVRETVAENARAARGGYLFQAADGEKPASIVLTVAGTRRLLSGSAWLQPDSCAVGNCARNGLTPLPAFSKVVPFSIGADGT